MKISSILNLLGLAIGSVALTFGTGQTEKAGLALLLVAGFLYVAGGIHRSKRKFKM